MSSNNDPGSSPVNHTTIWAVAAVLVAVIVAAVALSYTGMEAGAILALLSGLLGLGVPLVALLDRVTTVQRVNAIQDRKLDIIEERTNGGLEPRMRSAVDAALSERFGPAPGSTDGQP